jgi:UDP-glucose 6-dehydrogenase
MYNANFVLLGFNEINNESLCNNVSNIMKTLYKHNDKIDVIYKSYEECELFKYTLNVLFAVKVWYFNEISEICDKLNVDYQSLRTLFKLDSRVGNYGTIVPGDHGYGYDGTCLPKEQKGMKYLQNTLDIPNKVLDEIEKRNNYFRTK